jgi:cardiolipin synthase A/B
VRTAGRRPKHRLRKAGQILLRPIQGRRLPKALRPRGAYGTAARLQEGVRDPEFARLVARIDDSFFHQVEEVDLFVDGTEAFQAICDTIATATREVLVESYIIRGDATGYRLLEALAAAVEARRVRARVLVDAFGSHRTPVAYWAKMRQHGIDVRLFHRSWANPSRHFRRDHRKLLIVDRHAAFLGGMNIADEYGSSTRGHGGPWRDTQVRVRGSAAAELAAVFFENWTRAGGDPQPVTVPSEESDGGTRVLVLDARPGRGHVESAAVLAAIAGGARHRLWITNAYFAPGRPGIDLLAATVQRGVDVRLLLPGVSDVAIMRHAAHGWYHRLLKEGVRIYEFQPAVLHAKTAVADDFVSVIGSSNLDFRSFRFNAECNVVILDTTTGQAMAAAFERDLQQAVEITTDGWRQRSWLHRLTDRTARHLSPLL